MITPDQAALLAAHVLTEAGAWYCDADGEAFKTAAALLGGVEFLVPGAGAAVGPVVSVLTSRNAVIPGPTGPIVLIGAPDRADPVRFAEAAVAMAVCADLMGREGQLQTLEDFVGSSEERAVYEGHQWAARAFVRFLLTGAMPAPEAIVTELRAGALLPISDEQALMARGIVASTLTSARRGGVPSLRAEVSALKWLHGSAPDAILAPGWRS